MIDRPYALEAGLDKAAQRLCEAMRQAIVTISAHSQGAITDVARGEALDKLASLERFLRGHRMEHQD